MIGKMKHEVYGSATVGEKGQVVIPSELRKSFKIRPGDKLIVFARHGTIGLIPSEKLNNFLNQTEKMLEKFKKIRNV